MEEELRSNGEIGYNGWLVIEAFGLSLPDLAARPRFGVACSTMN